MLIVISPAKSLDFESFNNCKNSSFAHFSNETEKLVFELKKFSIHDLEKLMKISPKLAQLNFDRFQKFSQKFDQKNSRQALMAFDGDVYDGIDKKNYNEIDFKFAQKHLRILSGFYGILRPLDLIQPYRLEMGTDLKKFKIFQDLNLKNLYQFWGDKISNYLNEELNNQEIKDSGARHIINLASEEYFGVINPKIILGKVINIFFKEQKENALKIVGINAKKARGLMTNFAIKNKITNPQNLKEFCQENYRFEKSLSDEMNLVFIR
jgi:cytoplasmic iron level regulating protein YaaA (DUF328/UPF0246 family)